MASAIRLQPERHLLRWSGTLLLVGIVLTAAVTMLLHPSGDEDVHEKIFTEYAASLAQLSGVLLALGGLIVLHRALRPRTPTLSACAAGLVVATAAVWALLQAVDGITLKRAVDAWVAADGSGRAVRRPIAAGTLGRLWSGLVAVPGRLGWSGDRASSVRTIGSGLGSAASSSDHRRQPKAADQFDDYRRPVASAHSRIQPAVTGQARRLPGLRRRVSGW